MSVVDERGRIFGAINLIDASVIIFLVALLPVGYGAYLMFRPAQPTIATVTAVELGKEELRIANGSLIAQKLKVSGSGFNPLLRAQVGGRPALAFVFENPNSADVLVGDMAPGEYDLELLDGVQVVARAQGAAKIRHSEGAEVRVIGRFGQLTAEQTKSFTAGYKSGDVIRGGFEIVAIGAPQPSHQQIRFGESSVDLPAGGTELPAQLLLRCDGPAANCTVGGVSLLNRPPIPVMLNGGIGFSIDELLPNAAPSRAHLQVRFEGPQVGLMQAGDRDSLLDPRAAVITAIGARDANSAAVTLDAGVDSSNGGWSYRGQLVRPGSTFTLITNRYEARGVVARLDVAVPVKP